jgi:FKBP-type peptidyl-prolyl cis-trans isomerase
MGERLRTRDWGRSTVDRGRRTRDERPGTKDRYNHPMSRSVVLLLVAAMLSASCSRPESNAAAAAPIPAPPDVAAPPSDAIKTSSGLASKVLTPGTGTRHPRPNSQVTVHYTGWTTDGKMFDSSVQRGEPATFGLDGVIAGWTEGVQMMVEGEKRRFWIPQSLAYQGQPGQPAGMLVFDVELIRIGS